MAGLMEYKCPSCGGKLEFNSQTQRMKCPFCDSEFDVEELKDRDEVLNEAQPEQASPDAPASGDTQWEQPDGEWDDGETSHMKVYTCQSCGGEIVADETTGATKCPYCGSPVVLTGSFSGDLKPDYIIPFKLDKEAAKAALREHMSKKKLLPKLFSSENHIDEIKGVYVPFWLFDAEANADLSYRTTKVRTWADNNFTYTETSHFDVRRAGRLAFEGVPADGSSKMPDDLMESLETFSFSEAVDFQTAYLSGYLADRYDVTAEECSERVDKRIRSTTADTFRQTVTGYSSVSDNGGDIRLDHAKAKYALFPVWLLNTTYQGQKYTFAMNGQSGRFVGNMPMDKRAYWLWHVLYTLLFGGIAYGIYLLFRFL